MGLENGYHTLVSTANKTLLPFGSTYLCERSFSAMTAIKTKYWNKLNLEQDLEIAILQNVKLRFQKIMKHIQSTLVSVKKYFY